MVKCRMLLNSATRNKYPSDPNSSHAPEAVKVFVLEQNQKHSPRRTRSFQCIEFKKLFFLRDLRAFVVNILSAQFLPTA